LFSYVNPDGPADGPTCSGTWPSIFVRRRRLGLAAALSLWIVHVYADAAAGIDHLHAIDVAPIEGDALGAENLSTGTTLDPSYGIGQGTMVLATVVAIVDAAGTFGAITGIPGAATALVEQAAEALRRRTARRRHQGDSDEHGSESGKETGHGLRSGTVPQ
jgi:hypothetical protein